MDLNLQNIISAYETYPNVTLHMSNTPMGIQPTKRASPKAITGRLKQKKSAPLSLFPLYKLKKYARECPKSTLSVGTGCLYHLYGHVGEVSANQTCFWSASPNVTLINHDGIIQVLPNERGGPTPCSIDDCVESIRSMVEYHNDVPECRFKLMYYHCIEIVSETDLNQDLIMDRVKSAIKSSSEKFIAMSKTAKGSYTVTIYDRVDCRSDYLDVDWNRLKLTVGARDSDYHIVLSNNGGYVTSELHANYCKRVGIEYNESEFVYDILKFFSKETKGVWHGVHDKSKPVVA